MTHDDSDARTDDHDTRTDDPFSRIDDVLATRFDDHAVGERLHAVPPHVVHEVTVDGRRAVCKLAVGPEAHLRRDAQVLARACLVTSLPVPEVIAAGEGFYVAEWLDDVPEPAGDHDLDAWARTAGAGLATLHAEAPMSAPGPLRAGEDGLAVDARDTVAEALAGYLADLRPGVAGTGYANVLDEAAGWLRKHPDALAGASDPVLCHGNWLPDHVGVRDGAVRAVIDFERAVAAPAEHDYWRAAIPLFHAPGRDEEPAREAFRAGYESVRPLSEGFEKREPVHRLAIVASFVESLFVQNQHDRAGTERRADAFRESVLERIRELETTFG